MNKKLKTIIMKFEVEKFTIVFKNSNLYDKIKSK